MTDPRLVTDNPLAIRGAQRAYVVHVYHDKTLPVLSMTYDQLHDDHMMYSLEHGIDCAVLDACPLYGTCAVGIIVRGMSHGIAALATRVL